LQSITCEATTPPTAHSYCFQNVDKTIPVYVPQGTVADYKEAAEWKEFGNNILPIGGVPAGFESIQNSEIRSQKILRDGQIFILRDGKVYTITGQPVK